MPTQRPFLSNFLTLFRAHSIPKAAPSATTTSAVTASNQTLWTSANSLQKPQQQQPTSETLTTTLPIPINPKTTTYISTSASAAAGVANPDRPNPVLQHNISAQTHLPRSPSPIYGPQNKPQPHYPTPVESRRNRRRGSDSSASSGGFREVGGGGEKWFVGGRTAGGEERFYKLSMVRRDRSADRISADQLSL